MEQRIATEQLLLMPTLCLSLPRLLRLQSPPHSANPTGLPSVARIAGSGGDPISGTAAICSGTSRMAGGGMLHVPPEAIL